MTSFRQLEQRHISAEITLMEWNPMLDLIALATVSGEVLLHRLSWQKVWTFPSPSTKEKPVLVTAMAWRPDGKILAYAYDNGKVTLCDVENSEAVHLLDVHYVVTSLNWVETMEKEHTDEVAFYNDRSSEFLQKLYAFHKGCGSTTKPVEEVADDFKKMKGQKILNILAIGMNNGLIHLHSFGMFPSGYIDINPQKIYVEKVLSVTLSEDFRLLTILIEAQEDNKMHVYYYRTYDVPLFYQNIEELKVVALKYGQISSLLTYLSSTIRAISEAWEDILLEIDTKIHKYEEEKKKFSNGSVSDDFLELLMFGTPSDSLEKFLLHDLTESGLKKLGHSIELSYSNIQKLVLKRLQNVATSLFFNLNDLKGMAMWQEKFGALGFSEAAVNDALFSVGSFLLKAMEIQQVIDNSMKNFKAFIRWMYAVILRLSDEQVPNELSKVNQQDLNFVAEFLKENFAFDGDEEKKTSVKLERVAQYLKKDNLAYPASSSGNPWNTFLQENPSIKESNVIFPHYPEKSLVGQYTDLRRLIDIAVRGPWTVFKNTAEIKCSYSVYKTPHHSPPQISHSSCFDKGYLYTAMTTGAPPCVLVHLIKESTKSKEIEAIGLSFNKISSSARLSASTEEGTNHKILDVKFYNNETLTVLLVENLEGELNCPVLVQVQLKSLYSQMKPIINRENPIVSQVPTFDVGMFIEKGNYKRLESIKALQIAVSGSRKVVCVLFASRRLVRLFEMDVEEEEEEDFETDHDDSGVKDALVVETDIVMEDKNEEPCEVVS